MRASVLIIGGGLSGLHTAVKLHRAKVDFILVEARDRLGGRVESRNVNGRVAHGSRIAFDMGPAWFWPGQNRMLSLVQEFGLYERVFKQHSTGDGLFQDQVGSIRSVPGLASMSGAYRVDGGLSALCDALELELPPSAVLKGTAATDIEYSMGNFKTSVANQESNDLLTSDFVVVAMPPRISAFSLAFNPSIDDQTLTKLENTATWMASHAKLVAVYKTPFWRSQGLSGDVISYQGPLQEIHDASPNKGGPYALFGFVGLSPKQRHEASEYMQDLAIKQLGELFGSDALKPQAVLLKDWSTDQHTSTPRDQNVANFHAFNDIRDVTLEAYDNRLLWSGSETAKLRENNGYLEGALESSERTVQILLDSL